MTTVANRQPNRKRKDLAEAHFRMSSVLLDEVKEYCDDYGCWQGAFWERAARMYLDRQRQQGNPGKPSAA